MVDEYAGIQNHRVHRCRVQIPLWSMNTPAEELQRAQVLGSDSSMVDEYGNNYNLISNNNCSSDSSMVDEYDKKQNLRLFFEKFRFLYGR